MRLEEVENNVFNVIGALIRGYDWQLVRKPGVGTYAVIAGKTADDDDEHIIIEEYSAPDMRDIWDKMTVEEAAEAVFSELSDY